MLPTLLNIITTGAQKKISVHTVLSPPFDQD